MVRLLKFLFALTFLLLLSACGGSIDPNFHPGYTPVVSGGGSSDPAPTVTSLDITTGPLAGGTNITITGTGFLSGATVSFGGSAGTSVSVVNTTTITVTTPSHSAGAVNVVVTNSDSQSGTLTNGYTYQAAPTVTSLSINTGDIAGGTSTTITGTGFLSGATVSFGGSAGTSVSVVNPTTINVTTPSHSAGAVNVVVTNTDSQSGTLTNGFTYTSSTQTVFISSYTDRGGFGGVEIADFVCNMNASNAGLSGVWKAVLSSASVNASSRIAIAGGGIYNLRPAGSGGPQLVTTGAGLFSSGSTPFNNAIGYDETGTATTQNFWTGSSDSGTTLGNSFTCHDWISNSPGADAEVGTPTGTSSVLNSIVNDCRSTLPFLCIDGQSSGPAPSSNPTIFTVAGSGNKVLDTQVVLQISSTTGARIVYQTGATAPADCTSGTQISAYTVGISTYYTVTGLNPGTQYSFRACNSNNDQTAFSSGLTLSVTTASSSHFIFATTSPYNGALAGLSSADAICQSEGDAAGLTGTTWKAILSTSTVNANSRISITKPVVLIDSSHTTIATNSAGFWGGNILNPINLAADGSSVSSIVWTGTDSSGNYSGFSCVDWMSASVGQQGTVGSTLNTGSSAIEFSSFGCSNTSIRLYCISQ